MSTTTKTLAQEAREDFESAEMDMRNGHNLTSTEDSTATAILYAAGSIGYAIIGAAKLIAHEIRLLNMRRDDA